MIGPRSLITCHSLLVHADSRFLTGTTVYGFKEGDGGDTPAPIRTDAESGRRARRLGAGLFDPAVAQLGLETGSTDSRV